MTISREICLASRPVGMPAAENFALANRELAAPGAGEVLVQNKYMSVDPYMRGRMYDRPSYVPPFQIGEALQGGAIGVVVESNAEGLRKGDIDREWGVHQDPPSVQAEGAYIADPELYWRHLDSHVLRPQANRAGRIKHVWVKRNQKWPDHLHDCEIMQLAMVMLWNDLVSSSESIPS
jgi:hypothetical protein